MVQALLPPGRWAMEEVEIWWGGHEMPWMNYDDGMRRQPVVSFLQGKLG